MSHRASWMVSPPQLQACTSPSLHRSPCNQAEPFITVKNDDKNAAQQRCLVAVMWVVQRIALASVSIQVSPLVLVHFIMVQIVSSNEIERECTNVSSLHDRFRGYSSCDEGSVPGRCSATVELTSTSFHLAQHPAWFTRATANCKDDLVC